MRRLFAIIVAAIALAGCSMDNITVSYQTDQNDIYYASFEEFGDKTRTYVDEDVKLLWHEDDRISLFRTTLNEQFKFTGATGDNSGGFAAVPSDEWVTGNQVSTNYAVYPYDATTRLSNDEIIQLTMPAVQHYAENSFGRGANTMVAASENISSKFLPFRNLGGYIIVKLYGEDTTIKSIEFKGNNEEVIAGAATAEAKYGYLPVIAMSESGTTTITLDCGEEGVTISSDSANPTSFWFVVPPITFEGGFTFTITDINDNTFTKSTTKSQTVVRNEVKSMSAFEPTFEGEGEDPEVAPKPANNEIWYTNGSTTEPTTPYKTDAFSANIISNTYDANKKCWVIKFDGDVTTIGDNTFYNCSSLTTITIPDSVTSIGSSAFSKCSGLTSITIPDSVTTIGECAFYSCDTLTSVNIPDSVTTIGKSAFAWCSSLTSVTIPDSVTEVENKSFAYCTSLTSVTIPDSVTTIGEDAFYKCSSLTSVNIPDSVTTIGTEAFYGCSSLTSVNIPDSVTSIGESAFDWCSSLVYVYCQAMTPPILCGALFYNTNYDLKIFVKSESVEAYRSEQHWRDYAHNIIGYNFELGEIVTDTLHPFAVDLGLSVKWACCNIGASSPEEYGDYYAWGEICVKNEYTQENSICYNMSIWDISGNPLYDVAVATWGNTWRIPTHDEFTELCEQCEWTWTTNNGVDGMKVTGPNGNYIFLPAAANSTGHYWCATSGPFTWSADYIWFQHGDYVCSEGWTYRYLGFSIRPVKD